MSHLVHAAAPLPPRGIYPSVHLRYATAAFSFVYSYPCSAYLDHGGTLFIRLSCHATVALQQICRVSTHLAISDGGKGKLIKPSTPISTLEYLLVPIRSTLFIIVVLFFSGQSAEMPSGSLPCRMRYLLLTHRIDTLPDTSQIPDPAQSGRLQFERTGNSDITWSQVRNSAGVHVCGSANDWKLGSRAGETLTHMQGFLVLSAAIAIHISSTYRIYEYDGGENKLFGCPSQLEFWHTTANKHFFLFFFVFFCFSSAALRSELRPGIPSPRHRC